MIENENQYNITKSRIEEFRSARDKLESMKVPENSNEQLRHKAHLDTLNNQLERFYEEVREYEKSKKNNQPQELRDKVNEQG